MPFTPYPPEAPAIPDQACAVPYRRGKDGRIEYCLITSTQGRWIFPKGIIEPEDSFEDTALKEAFEEAGLHGQLVGEPLGAYRATKNGDRLLVVAFLMEVKQSDATWAEEHIRRRRWVSHSKAAKLLDEPSLRELLDAAAHALRA